MSDEQSPSMPTMADLLEQIDELRAEVAAMRTAADHPRATRPPPADEPTTRRRALQLAGAASAGVLVATTAPSGRAAAADPNDVVKNVVNAVSGVTAMDGSFDGEVLRLRNTAANGRALLGISQGVDIGAIRGDNSNTAGIGGVGVSGNAPGGRDFLAFGSGRIGMNTHAFDLAANTYTLGEIHQQGGTTYSMVTSSIRRSIVGPATAGALYPITPTRVYDSRSPAPAPGTLSGGASRVISVADGRSLDTGAVTVANLVPVGATAVVFNLTVTDTVGAGFLAITPGSATGYSASTINWTTSGTTVANASVVGVDGSRQVKVFGGGGGGASTHFIIDISGYYL